MITTRRADARPRPSRTRTAVLAAAAAIGLTLSAGSPAMAHNVLIESTPEDGSTVTTQPGTIELVYDQAVKDQFTQVAILNEDEAACQVGEPTVDENTVLQDVQDLPDGEYTVSYRVISADGHPVTGTLTFTMASEGGGAAEPCAGSGDGESGSAESGNGESGDAAAGGADEAGDQDQAAGSDSDDGGGNSTAIVVGIAAVGILALVGIFLVGRRRPGRPADGAGNDTSNPEA